MERRARKISKIETALLIVLSVLGLIQFIFAFFPAIRGTVTNYGFAKATDVESKSIIDHFFDINSKTHFGYAVAFILEYVGILALFLIFPTMLILLSLVNSGHGSKIAPNKIKDLSIAEIRKRTKVAPLVLHAVILILFTLTISILFFCNAKIITNHVYFESKYVEIHNASGSIGCGIISLLVMVFETLFFSIFIIKNKNFWFKQLVARKRAMADEKQEVTEQHEKIIQKEENTKPVSKKEEDLSTDSLDEQMKKVTIIGEYNKLYKMGAITLDEFEAKKKEIL